MIKAILVLSLLTSCGRTLGVAESENTCKLMSIRNGHESYFISSTDVMKKGHAMCYGLTEDEKPAELGEVSGTTSLSDIKEGYQDAMCEETEDCSEFMIFTNELFQAIENLIYFRKVQ